MPQINVEVDSDVDIEVSDFLESCSSNDIQNIVEYLRTEGHISSVRESSIRGIAETQFEESLNVLHGKWNSLTTEEEDTIKSIAKKFLH